MLKKQLGDRQQIMFEARFRECASLKLPLPPFFEHTVPKELSRSGNAGLGRQRAL